MRADRLLSLLMLLQTRGRMTARALANELEVSERTIYRDIIALSTSGIPVYGEAGPDGGFSLVDNYRTSLTGLTEGEVRALFMLNIPTPLADLGVTQELKTALLKLSAALPAHRRADETLMRQRFYLDSSGWKTGTESVPYLQAIQHAVWHDQKLLLTYRPLPTLELEQLVEPYGLVAKAGIWYVVCLQTGRFQVHRISHLRDVQSIEETFARVADLDLGAFWQKYCDERDQQHAIYPVQVRVAPNFILALPYYFGNSLHAQIEAAQPDSEGQITLTLAFSSLEEARNRLLDFGQGVEVLKPFALRLSMADFARQILKVYETKIGAL
ncbi:MAG: WYL domain-containing protein [Anaerolineales bacterium]|nr:WYL domain-containing protein [Anaerolineales bacterium]